MTDVFCYENLSKNRMDDRFIADGQVLVTLSAHRADALITLIQELQLIQSWQKNRTPRVARLWPLLKILGTVTRISISHSRLFELSKIIASSSSSQQWNALPDGNILFRFSQ